MDWAKINNLTEKALNRRNFLKGTGMAGLGLLRRRRKST